MSIPASPGHTPPPFVGRDRERAFLHQHLVAALAGRGNLVLIGGEAGIGKTALAETICREATDQGALVLVGRCFDLTETAPYGPWVELFGQYRPIEEMPPLPAAFARRGVIGEVASRAVLFQQLLDFFTSLTAKRPLVLLLDDAHWADAASLDVLRFVARNLAALRLLLIVTYRGDELTRRHPVYQLLPLLVREARAERLDLRTLENDAVHALVTDRYTLPTADARQLVAYLQGRGEGNALFLGELLRSLEETDVLMHVDGAWRLGNLREVPVPSLLRQVITARLNRLGDEAVTLLTAAAVVGHEIDLQVWAQIAETSEDSLLDLVERAEEAHVLVASDGGGIRFAHALIREALYESLPVIRRRRLHRHAGEVRAALPHPDTDAVAYHFLQAGDSRAVEWLITAGERAQRAFAWATAVARYEAALGRESMSIDDEHRGWLLYRTTRLLRHLDRERALGYAEEAMHVATVTGDPALTAAARFARGYLLFIGDHPGDGLAEVTAAVEVLGTLSPEDGERIERQDRTSSFADLRGFAILSLATTGRFSEALVIAERAPTIARPRAHDLGEVGNEPWKAIGMDGYGGLAFVRSDRGFPSGARSAAMRAYALARASGSSNAMGYALRYLLDAVLLPYETDAVAERRRTADEADMLRQRVAGTTTSSVLGERRAIFVDLPEGRWEEAESVLAQLVARGGLTERWAGTSYGEMLRTRGERAMAWEQVRKALPQGYATSPGTGYYRSALSMLRLGASLALEEQNLTEAKEWLDAHDRWLMWSGGVLGQSEGQALWAQYFWQAGNVDLAHTHAERAITHASAPRQPLALLAACRLLGALDIAMRHYDDAAKYLHESLTLAEACIVPYERALTLLAMAELRAAMGEDAVATALLQEVRAVCESIGAMPALSRAMTMLAQLQARTQSPRALPAGLSEREVEVLRLLAAGKTNREIADALFLAPGTVNVHVTHILTKTNTANRTEAALFARDHDLA